MDSNELFNEVSGDKCKFMIFLMLCLHDRVLLEPRIKKLAELMAEKKNWYEILTPGRLQQLWPNADKDFENAKWIAKTYEDYLHVYNGQKSTQVKSGK